MPDIFLRRVTESHADVARTATTPRPLSAVGSRPQGKSSAANAVKLSISDADHTNWPEQGYKQRLGLSKTQDRVCLVLVPHFTTIPSPSTQRSKEKTRRRQKEWLGVFPDYSSTTRQYAKAAAAMNET